MKRRAAIAGAVVVLLSAGATPAAGQFNVLSPIFRDLNGGAVWGSIGVAARSGSARRDQRPIWRGGFAAFYGPFGGGSDTTLVHVLSVADSTDTVLVNPDGSTTKRRTAVLSESRSESRKLGRGGKILLAVGYQHSPYYRIAGTPLTQTVAVGGLYLGVFLGPYQPPPFPRRLQGYLGIGGTIVQLKDMAGRVDTLGIQLNTERTIAPELSLMLAYVVRPNYRILVAGSYQYMRFGSVAYKSVEDGRLIPGSLLASLPSEIRLESWHLTLGVSFVASSLIPGR